MSFDHDERCSVTSTTGGSGQESLSGLESVGYIEPETTESNPQAARVGFASAFLNGVQLIRCSLPERDGAESVFVVADDMDVTGELGGLGLDILFVSTHNPCKGYEFHARMECVIPPATEPHSLDLGFVRSQQESSHFGHYLSAQPTFFKLVVTHTPIERGRFPPAEKELIKQVLAVMENPNIHKSTGSIGSIVLNNKAKESVLYERVVGKGYGGSWQDFVKAHPEVLHLFHYSEAEIAEHDLSPQIKRSDGRICYQGCDKAEILRVDIQRCLKQREDEEKLKQSLQGILANGALSQRELLARLQDVEGFTEALFPSYSLLMRFLAFHTEHFVWTAGPDQPTRIGATNYDRIHLHESAFARQQVLPSAAAEHKQKYVTDVLADVRPQPTYRHDPYLF